jgi:hypothetical protein
LLTFRVVALPVVRRVSNFLEGCKENLTLGRALTRLGQVADIPFKIESGAIPDRKNRHLQCHNF